MQAAVEAHFRVETTTTLLRNHLEDLAHDRLAAVHLQGLLPAGLCLAITRAFDRLPTFEYDRARVPTPILRFGPSLNDHRGPAGHLDARRYWPAVADAAAAWPGPALGQDPREIAIETIGSAWGGTVRPATIGGHDAYAGTLREINTGTLVHYDDVQREFPAGLFDDPLDWQLSFNAWVAVPPHGGAITIWGRRWRPGDADHSDTYGFTPEVVAGCDDVSVRPLPGDAVFFNPLNYHQAQALPPRGLRRVALAFFIGCTRDGHLVLWS